MRSNESSTVQFILRLLNTNVDGKQKIMYALTRIKGVGRRYSNLVCKKADVDLNKRYGIPGIRTNWSEETVYADFFPYTVPVKSPPKNSSELSPSSRTLPSTRSPSGS